MMLPVSARHEQSTGKVDLSPPGWGAVRPLRPPPLATGLKFNDVMCHDIKHYNKQLKAINNTSPVVAAV